MEYKDIWCELKTAINYRINYIRENPTDIDENFAKRIKDMVEEDQLVKIEKLMNSLEERITGEK